MRQIQPQQPQSWEMVQVAGAPGGGSNSVGPAQAGLAEFAAGPMIQANDHNFFQHQAREPLNLEYAFPEAAPTASKDYSHMPDADYYTKLAQLESGGSGGYSALNKGSGAFGKYQFIPGTLKGMAKQMNKSEGYLRTPDGQEEMVRRFTATNDNALRRAGLPVNNFTRYMAHQQGAGGAVQLLKHGIGNHKNMASNMPAGMEVNANNFLSHWQSRFA